MNKRNIMIIILIIVLLGLMVTLVFIPSIIGLETFLDNHTKLIIKENKDAGKVKIYDDYYDVYLCNVDADIVINGKRMSLKEAFDTGLTDPDELMFYISMEWDQVESFDDGGTEIYANEKYEITKYHRMIPNKQPWRSAVDYYNDLFIGTRDCKYNIEY